MGHRLRVALVVAVVGMSACSSAASDDGVVELELFQFKGEAIAIFDELVADFNAEHPDIRVVQNAVPNADAAIRVRLVRDDVPDVMTLNANGRFGQLAQAGVFRDFADDPVLDEVNPAILKILTDLGSYEPGQVNGIPFANNADGVIYNTALFDDNGVEVPTTWDELLAAIDTFEQAGVTPIYGTLGDAWTSLPVWNALASNLPPDDFFTQLRDDQATFEADYEAVAARMAELYDHTQPTLFERGYDDGNQAFANGEAAMYLQGSWAIPVIEGFEPDFEVGTFPLPTDDPDQTRLVSGVDVAFTTGADTEHPDEVLTFIEWMLTPDVQQRYAADQAAIPARKDLFTDEPALAGLLPWFEQERLVGFSDHQVPASIPLDAFNQEFLRDGNQDAYLSNLDEEWDKYIRRTT